MTKLVTSGNKEDKSHSREMLQVLLSKHVLQQQPQWLCQLAGVDAMHLSKQYLSFFADDVLLLLLLILLLTADPNTDLTPLPYAYIPIKGQ